MTLTNPSDANNPIEVPEDAVESQPISTAMPADEAPNLADQSSETDEEARRRRILIGSQRNPAAYRPKPRHDWKPINETADNKAKSAKKPEKPGPSTSGPGAAPTEAPAFTNVMAQSSGDATQQSEIQNLKSVIQNLQSELKNLKSDSPAPQPPVAPAPSSSLLSGRDQFASQKSADAPQAAPEIISALAAAIAESTAKPSRPSVREKLTKELQDEIDQALGGSSLDDLMNGKSSADAVPFEVDSIQTGQVVAIRRDDVFVEFQGREQGIVSLRQFDVPPRPGATVRVVVQRQNPEDGLYELSVPNKAVQVDDWSDLVEGALIEVRVTGHNTGGLECEINHIRGFIPVSQIALYRIEDLAPYVDQKFACIITEANPDRRNLVLSRRAVLEREREQAREQMLKTLQPGQILDGTVRKLMDFGAFVELGEGVDGLLHVSQLAWGRVKHPSDVLHEGQMVKVRVDKVDPQTGRISLAYRDLLESPWTSAANKYPPNTVAKGTVTKLMDFGAFVEIEPGIEGLVHISELSHKRVFRCADVVKEGQEVEVQVLSVDAQAQRMSLSMKELSAPPESAKKEEEEPTPAKQSKKSNKPTGPLLGGLGKTTGERFGLKW